MKKKILSAAVVVAATGSIVCMIAAGNFGSDNDKKSVKVEKIMLSADEKEDKVDDSKEGTINSTKESDEKETDFKKKDVTKTDSKEKDADSKNSASSKSSSSDKKTTTKKDNSSSSSSSKENQSNNQNTSSSSGSSPSGSQASKPNQSGSSGKPTHTHTWVPQYTTINHPAEYDTVYHSAVYEEAQQCKSCSTLNPDTAHCKQHALNGENSGTYSVMIKVSDEWTEQVLVRNAWSEKVVSGYICKGCGATK